MRPAFRMPLVMASATMPPACEESPTYAAIVYGPAYPVEL